MSLYRLLFAGLFAAAYLSTQTAPAAAQGNTKPQSWFQFGAEFRGRFEGATGLNYTPDRNDFYYLHRIRLNLSIQPASWLRFFVQPHNVLAPGHRGPVPASVEAPFDFHQGFAELTRRVWTVRAGRQEVNFGAQRLIGSANWGNTSRSYDGLRATRRLSSATVDAFATTVVQTERDRLDSFLDTARQLHGVHVASDKWIRGGLLEAYSFWKISNSEPDPAGAAGRTSHYTAGLRALGKLPRRFDYNLEMALQAGQYASLGHRAWAGYWNLGYSLTGGERSPRLVATYTYASGNKSYGQGRSRTFDQLYPTNHAYYGFADRHSWRNLHEAAGTLVLRPARGLIVNCELHSFWLTTRKDAFYDFNGRAVVRNPRATSNHLDVEADVNAVWDLTRHLQIIVGYTHIFPGAFIEQSSPGSPITVPYAQWLYRF